jgi:hypothetical protein
MVPKTVPPATPQIIIMIPRQEICFHDLQRTYISAGMAIKRSKTTTFVRGSINMASKPTPIKPRPNPKST